MDVLFVICGVAVFFVFAVAGISKLRSPHLTAQMLIDFGFVRNISPRAAMSLPAVEILVAGAILIPATAWWGAFGAAMLLGGFTLAIIFSLIRGRHPTCNCFGQTRLAPITWATALRNVILTMCAGALLAFPERLERGVLPELIALFRTLDATIVLLFAIGLLVMVVQAWVNVNIIRQQGRLLLKIDNLEYRIGAAGIALTDIPEQSRALAVGTSAPDFSATTLGGKTIHLTEVLRDRTLALVFVNADCKPCAALMPQLERLKTSNGIDIQIITSGSRRANIEKLGAAEFLDGAAVQEGFELNDLFGVIATPSAICISPNGTIASSIAIGQDAVTDLLDRVSAENLAPHTVREIVRPAAAFSS